jgi:hypothetical protein
MGGGDAFSFIFNGVGDVSGQRLCVDTSKRAAFLWRDPVE